MTDKSNIIKKFLLAKERAHLLITSIQGSQERQKKSEIRRLRRIRHTFEDKVKEYAEPLQEAREDFQDKLDDLNAKGNYEGRGIDLNRMNGEFNDIIMGLNDGPGKEEVEFKFSPEDFEYLKRQWEKCDEFLPSKDVQEFVEDVDTALEAVEDLDLDKLKEENSPKEKVKEDEKSEEPERTKKTKKTKKKV